MEIPRVQPGNGRRPLPAMWINLGKSCAAIVRHLFLYSQKSCRGLCFLVAATGRLSHPIARHAKASDLRKTSTPRRARSRAGHTARNPRRAVEECGDPRAGAGALLRSAAVNGPASAAGSRRFPLRCDDRDGRPGDPRGDQPSRSGSALAPARRMGSGQAMTEARLGSRCALGSPPLARSRIRRRRRRDIAEKA